MWLPLNLTTLSTLAERCELSQSYVVLFRASCGLPLIFLLFVGVHNLQVLQVRALLYRVRSLTQRRPSS